MSKYKYIGEDKFFIKNGDIVYGEFTIWSIKKPNSPDRESVKLLYVNGAGFKGEDLPINSNSLIDVSLNAL